MNNRDRRRNPGQRYNKHFNKIIEEIICHLRAFKGKKYISRYKKSTGLQIDWTRKGIPYDQ